MWYEDKEESWIPAQITKEEDNGNIEAKYNDKIFNFSSKQFLKMDMVELGILSMNINDIIDLPQVNEGSVLYLIRKRYLKDQIYTKLGQIQIAVNPYKRIEVDINNYKKLKNDEQIDRIEPHCFATAMRAYNYCIESKTNQSIIISGESGSGKTWTTKV